MRRPCLCIDVGGSSIKYALVDESLTMSHYGKTDTPYNTVETYLNTLQNIFKNFEGKVEGVSLSVPGRIDGKNGICIDAGALKYATGLHIVEELETRCRIPVFVMNDAKSAALAESSFGAIAGCKTAVAIILGTGIGGAIVHNGDILEGTHFNAGEFSYLSVGSNIDSLDGMLWSRIGNQYLLNMARRIRRLPDEQRITGEMIFQWLEEKDEGIQKLFDTFTMDIAKLILNLQFILDPDKFAIGGGISRQPALIESIRRNLEYLYSIYPMEVPQATVVNCRYYNEANLIGAYANFKKLYNKKGEFDHVS